MSDPNDQPSLVSRERHSLADLFDQVGPAAPTLCAGWDTRDLAAHLVLRESHPSAIGIVVGPVSAWTERTQRALASGDFAALVDRFRRGPPRYSPMRLPGADRATNTFEHFVHHEDVRRAATEWQPRLLSASDQHELWTRLNRLARWYLRAAPVPVDLVAPGLGSIQAGKGEHRVTITGPPAELVLHVHGRREHSLVEITGSEPAIQQWADHDSAV